MSSNHIGKWFTTGEDDTALLFRDQTETTFKVLITICNSEESKSNIKLEVDGRRDDDEILMGECRTYLVYGNEIKVIQMTYNEIDNESDDGCLGTYTISLIKGSQEE